MTCIGQYYVCHRFHTNNRQLVLEIGSGDWSTKSTNNVVSLVYKQLGPMTLLCLENHSYTKEPVNMVHILHYSSIDKCWLKNE